MKTLAGLVAVLGLGLFSSGCATKKYVNNRMSPVETRVTELDKKTSETNELVAAQGKEIDELGRDLSRTKEKLGDTDVRARAAAEAAERAGLRAGEAASAADRARMLAEQGIAQNAELRRTMDSMLNYRMLTSQAVLFKPDRRTLDDEGKALLDDLVKQVGAAERFVIEVQGFTDSTGPKAYNVALSQDRAGAVARYLSVQHQIPLRKIHVLGAGSDGAVADNKTREGRKQNRRVEVKVWVPETDAAPRQVTTDN
jgi:outer membrane protein OmpA-like peptidoglycan-associated protein